jgi:hypothetical protein
MYRWRTLRLAPRFRYAVWRAIPLKVAAAEEQGENDNGQRQSQQPRENAVLDLSTALGASSSSRRMLTFHKNSPLIVLTLQAKLEAQPCP